MSNVFVSLGTNLGNKELNLIQAIAQIELKIGTIAQKSSIYKTEPWGYQSFNNFLNQVICVETTLSPNEVLHNLLQIEKNMGRVRASADYEDRIIDLDILLYDEIIINQPELKIPHPNMHLRQFILEPLSELQPMLTHPKLNQSILALLKGLKQQ